MLMLITRTPCATAHAMPLAIDASGQLPSAKQTLMGTKLAPSASPATPFPLFADAAMIPATWVPWP